MLEAHTITGSGDLLCRIVARSNADLQRVIDQIVAYEGIARASTIIALAEQIPYRMLPLVTRLPFPPSGLARRAVRRASRHGLTSHIPSTRVYRRAVRTSLTRRYGVPVAKEGPCVKCWAA